MRGGSSLGCTTFSAHEPTDLLGRNRAVRVKIVSAAGDADPKGRMLRRG
jgi:hypothetical protein